MVEKMLPFKKNDTVRITIDAMSSEGMGIGRYEGVAIFVPLTAIGDEIEAKIVKLQKNFAFGIISKFIYESKDRVPVDCPYFNQCGGCVYRHIDPESENKIKEERVKDCLERIGGFTLGEGGIEFEGIEGGSRYNYRNKAQIPLGIDKNNKLIMGYYAKHSHRIVDNKKCLLHPEIFNSIADVFRDWFEQFGDTVYNEETHKGVLRHLYLRMGEKTGDILFSLVINGDKVKNLDKLAGMLKLNIPNIKSFVLNINKEKTNVILGNKNRIVFGQEHIKDILCDRTFNISPLSFYQVNRKQAEKLYNKASEYADLKGNETLLDLYCGAGTIGLSLISNNNKLIGVEIIPDAIENAKKNAAENGIENTEFICGDAAKAAAVLNQRGEKPDVIIVDPPRKGLDENLILTISEMAPKRVVYVSCDPATLGRDLKIFAANGYTPVKAKAFDLFPATSHVETVCLLINTPSLKEE